MADLNIMPLMTDSLMADCGTMPDERFGQYMKLLISWWRDGCRPSTLEHLEEISGVSQKNLGKLERLLTETPEGWTQKKLFEVWDATQRRKHKAKQAASTRWGDEKSENGDANGHAREMPPINHKPLSKENPHPQRMTPSARGGFDVLVFLGDEALAEAKRNAPGWDIYHLATVYNAGAAKRGAPKVPEKAFPAWCASYTKGKPPQ